MRRLRSGAAVCVALLATSGLARLASPASAAAPTPVLMATSCPEGTVAEVRENPLGLELVVCRPATTPTTRPRDPSQGGPTGTTRPRVTTTTRPISDDRFLNCSYSWVSRDGASWLPVATRGEASTNAAGSSARASICLGPLGVAVDTASLIWVLAAAGGEDPAPGLSIDGQIEEYERLFNFALPVPTLNPVDPLRQIAFLPTWISVGSVAGVTPAPLSVTSVLTGDTATATAIPMALLFTPGDGSPALRCPATNGLLGVPWAYGDDERLNNSPGSIPGACRYRYEELPAAGATYPAELAIEYEITYVGLTGAPGPVVRPYTGNPNVIQIDVVEQVAVNVPNTPQGGSDN
jgi:hypothetical protein